MSEVRLERFERNTQKSVAASAHSKWVEGNPTKVRETVEASSSLGAAERTQYEAWRKGGKLPDLDIAKHVKLAPVNPAQLLIYRSRAIGFGILYKTPAAGYTPENVAYFQDHYKALIPLLVAATKLRTEAHSCVAIGTRRPYCGGNDAISNCNLHGVIQVRECVQLKRQ